MLNFLFFTLIINPIVKVIFGVNTRNKQNLPVDGPAILIANHNSHFDTAVLMCLYPMSKIGRIHAVAAADYWAKNWLISWFATKVLGVIPITRSPNKEEMHKLFDPVTRALKNKEIVILYPEGSRGEAEQMSKFKKGIGHLARANPDVPIVPIYLYGLGKVMPKGEGLIVPFVCDVNIGKARYWNDDLDKFCQTLQEDINRRGQEIRPFVDDNDGLYF